jgi:hypothetical protein
LASLSWKWRLRLLALGVAAVVGLVPFEGIVWDGGFRDAEFRLRFVDPTDRPVPGVTLRVLTAAGGVCHLYPVNEFLPDGAPASDADGRMVFHHASRGLEFAGHESRNLVGMQFGETRSPQYLLVFDHGGREVYRVWYADLQPGARQDHWTVTRGWRPSDWPAREHLAHPDEGSHARRLRLFDGDRNGVLDREERTAAGYCDREWARAAELGEDPRASRDVDFLVVERTITISVPE